MSTDLKTADVELKKPLTTFEKIKAGAKGFVKSAIEYIPRGLVFSGIAFGASAVLKATVGWDPLEVAKIDSVANLATRVAGSLAIGGVISGGVGGFTAAKKASDERNAEIAQQQGELERCKALGNERVRAAGYEGGSVPVQQGLPHHKAGKQHVNAPC